jgi:hypothetical protein
MLSGSERFLKPSSAAVPTAAANEQYYDDDDDQKSGVVHIPLRALEVRNGAKAAAVPARPEYKKTPTERVREPGRGESHHFLGRFRSSALRRRDPR